MPKTQVATALPIEFSEVCEVVYQDFVGTNSRPLTNLFAHAIVQGGSFNGSYSGSKDRLSNFRGYTAPTTGFSYRYLILYPFAMPSAQYSNVTGTEIGATAQSGSGAQNSTAIVNQAGHTASSAKQCLDLVYGGYSDWFLQSSIEGFQTSQVSTVNSSINSIGGDPFVSEDLWRSTEHSAVSAFTVNEITGTLSSGVSKSSSRKSRAVRIEASSSILFGVGDFAYGGIVIALIDVVAPSVPSGLGSATITDTSFTLSWSASSDNVGVTGYNIYKNSNFHSTTTNLSRFISSLTPGESNTWTVSAFDQAGNESATSTGLVVEQTNSVDTESPSAPTNLQSSSISNSGFTLSWTASTDNVGVTGYKIYKDAVLFVDTLSSSTSKSITGVSSGDSSTWTVKAYDLADNLSLTSSGILVKIGPSVTGFEINQGGESSGVDACSAVDSDTSYKSGSSSNIEVGDVWYVDPFALSKFNGGGNYFSNGVFNFQISSTGVTSNINACL